MGVVDVLVRFVERSAHSVATVKGQLATGLQSAVVEADEAPVQRHGLAARILPADLRSSGRPACTSRPRRAWQLAAAHPAAAAGAGAVVPVGDP